MAKIHLPQSQPIYDAARRFVDAALRADDSIFTPGAAVWTPENIEYLYAHFVKNPDESGGTFLDKFYGQLQEATNAGATPAIYQLAGELLYVHVLIATGNIGPHAKRKLITTVLGWSPAPVPIPPERNAALDGGLARTGIAFLTYRPFQLWFLIEFVRAWKQQPTTEREQMLQDPWAFKAFVFGLPIDRAYAQREALLHIVHPDAFEAIVSREHKQNFTRQYAEYITEQSDDVDRKLAQIRARANQLYGRTLSLYELGPAPPQASPLPHTLGPRLRPYVELVALLTATGYRPEDIVNKLGQLRRSILPELVYDPDPLALVRDLMNLRLIYVTPGGYYARWMHLADASVDIMLRYAALTLLVPLADGGYDLPVLHAPWDGQPHPATDWPYGDALLAWYKEAGLVQHNPDGSWQSLPNALEPLDSQVKTAQALNTFLEHLRRVRQSRSELPPLADDGLPTLDPDTLEERIAEIGRELLIDRTTILRIYRALIAGQHVILSGPPGTGKTHLARLLPQVLFRDDEPTVALALPTDPTVAPTVPPIERRLSRQGYAVDLVTATEDWGVRQVVGGIVPQLVKTGDKPSLVYGVRHGALTRAVLGNYAGYDGEQVPAREGLRRQEVLGTGGERFRGRWLVIDEFTRAPIDAAFGGLLTTLGGQRTPLSVPSDDGRDVPVPLPRDFRIIGTLNSFDRHFLNQISEAMKRRFTFIDVLPPGPELAEAEQAMAVYRALLRLGDNGILDITADQPGGGAVWEDVVRVSSDGRAGAAPYRLDFEDAEAERSLARFWRIFRAIRVYRQLGTAQAESVISALFTGQGIGMGWPDALDSALADVLADQLQVLARDEQRALLAYLAHAHDREAFAKQLAAILGGLPPQRQQAHLGQLRLADTGAGPSPIDGTTPGKLNADQLARVFPLDVDAPLLDDRGLFARRLSAFVNEKGL